MILWIFFLCETNISIFRKGTTPKYFSDLFNLVFGVSGVQCKELGLTLRN